jgi:hypothetical protein
MLPSDADVERYPGLKRWVIGSFSSHKKPNDIIFQLCQQTGWDWSTAKQFVEQVSREGQKEINQRRMPLLLGIGLLMMIGGALAFLSAFPDISAVLSEMEPPLDAARVIQFILASRSEYLLIAKLATGMAMFIGGAVGSWRTVMGAMTGEGENLMETPSSKPQ